MGTTVTFMHAPVKNWIWTENCFHNLALKPSNSDITDDTVDFITFPYSAAFVWAAPP